MTRIAMFATLLLMLSALAFRPAVAGARTPGYTYTTYARLTCYTETGITASGAPVQWGVTAGASWDIPLGSVITYADGQTRVVQDRGALNNPLLQGAAITGYAWIDAACPDPAAFVAEHGDWGWVTVQEP